jgi:Domain of unknown function (DUF4282)
MAFMTPIKGDLAHSSRRGRIWSLLTFDHLITGQVIHLVYWAGLSVIVVAAFSVVGASIGVAWREGSWASILLAIPVLVVGLLVVGGMGLIWRAFCEFYVAIFRISDDLAALRREAELEEQRGRPPR